MARFEETVPGPGGSRKLAPKGSERPIRPTPVTIIRQPRPTSSRVAGAVAPVTRLGTPTAFVMLVGLFFVYYALRGWDAKYGTFNGAFAGKGSTPTGTKPRYGTAAQEAVATVVAGGTSSNPVITTSASIPTTSTSAAIVTLQKYIKNLLAVKQPTAAQKAELVLYQQRLATYQARQMTTA